MFYAVAEPVPKSENRLAELVQEALRTCSARPTIRCARTSEGMSAMIASCTQFVEFHGLGFNKKKCEYVVMNQKMNVENEWDRPTWPSGEEIVEKIRVTGDQEQRRQEAQDKWQRRANKVLHSTLFDLPPKIIGSRPQEEWTELQGELGRATDRWKETQTTMWWAGAGRCADTEDIQEAFARGRGKDTWWEASMGECMAEEEGEMLAEFRGMGELGTRHTPKPEETRSLMCVRLPQNSGVV